MTRVNTASPRDALGWRMRALLLDHDASDTAAAMPHLTPSDTVRHLTAMQGQDWHASLWAIGARSPAGTTLAEVHDALRNGSIVRSWPMRGTVHLTAAEDLGWIQRSQNNASSRVSQSAATTSVSTLMLCTA